MLYQIIVNRVKWLYEARQTSKEQTKMARFMLAGPRPAIVRSCTMHELRNRNVSIG